MEYTYAALLLHETKQPITAENLKKVLTAAGASADDAKLKAVAAALEGVNIADAIKQAAVVAAPSAAGGEKKEEKKAAEEEGKKEEEAAAGLASLFG